MIKGVRAFNVSVFLVFALLLAGASVCLAADDNHFIQDDDYFFTTDKHLDRGVRVHIGKMMTPASPETKGEAEFLAVSSGKKVFTANYWKSRTMNIDEIRIGAQVIYFAGERRDGAFRMPKKKEEARKESWYMATVTDVSDLYKQIVTLAGNKQVDVANLRMPYRDW